MKQVKISYSRQKKIVNNYKNVSVLVVGDVIIDEYLWGDVQRISPEAPVPIVNVRSESIRLGGAANVIQNLKSINVTPYIVALCGNDSNGDRLMKLLQGQKCSTEGIVVTKKRPTTIKTRIVARHQQIVRADKEVIAPLSKDESSQLWKKTMSILPRVSGVIISDYGKGVISRSFTKRLIGQCKKLKVHISIDPKEHHFDLYKQVDIITPNLKEAHAALGIPYYPCSIEKVRQLGWKLMTKLKLGCLLVTLGEQGMALFENKGKKFTHLPTVAQEVYDVTGAGDTVISVYAASIASRASPLEASWLANHAAGLTIAELGTACVTPKTLLNAARKPS